MTDTRIEHIAFSLPCWAIPAITHSDISALEDNEIEAVNELTREADRLARDNGASHWHWSPRYDAGIAPANDMPGDTGKLMGPVQVVDLALVYIDNPCSSERTMPITRAD